MIMRRPTVSRTHTIGNIYVSCSQYEKSAYSQRPRRPSSCSQNASAILYVALRVFPCLCALYTAVTCMKAWLRSGMPSRFHRDARDSTSDTSPPILLIATRLTQPWSISTSPLPLYQQFSAVREIAP
jgi:hypothetical protein